MVDLPRLLHVLALLERVREGEQRLIHPRVVLELVVVGQRLVDLDRVLQRGLGLGGVVLDRLLPLRLVLAAVGLDRRLGRLQAVEAVELRVHLGEAEVQVRLLGGVGVRRLLDQALEQLDLLAADVADRALDLEDVVGADRRALRLVVGLGRRRPHAVADLDVDLDRVLALVLGLFGAHRAGEEAVRGEREERRGVGAERTGHRVYLGGSFQRRASRRQFVSDETVIARQVRVQGRFGWGPRRMPGEGFFEKPYLGHCERTLNR